MAGAASLPEFGDFDDEVVYNRCRQALLQVDTLNFVIDFDGTKAYAVENLSVATLQQLLLVEVNDSGQSRTRNDNLFSVSDPCKNREADFEQLQRPKHTNTRWINIWAPEKQKDLVATLSAYYGFSPRLLGIMCSDHSTSVSGTCAPHPTGLRSRAMKHFAGYSSAESQSLDLEKEAKARATVPRSTMPDLSHYKIVDEVWHYCSVDWSPKYLCIGYNSLSDARIASDKEDKESDEDSFEATEPVKDKPTGVRTWTWLILCNDGTVISVYENPFPGHPGYITEKEQKLLEVIRRNLLNVFMQLSKVNDTQRIRYPINILDIRPGLLSQETSKITITDSPSLLFYYLYDDWYTSYALVAKSEHQYAMALEKLRENMFNKPQIPLIQGLHQYGRQLAVLKRMYQSYALIIERILDRQKPLNPGAIDQHYIRGGQNDTVFQEGQVTPEVQTYGAALSSAATVRFERLRDRINLYALSEIQECLDEKESLVFLNFSLITLKESQAVERLTRITILLAKITILFMPVSLMTAYFSTQLIDVANIYSLRTYWICFAVIMSLSFVVLAVFGVASGTVEGKLIYRSLTQTVLEAGKGRWKESRRMRGK